MKKSHKLLIIGMMVILLTSACAAPTPPPPTPTPSPLDLIRAFQDTYNKRDTDGLLALLVDTPDWSIGFTASSKEAVHNIAEYSFEINSHIEFTDCAVDNNMATCKTAITDDCQPPELDAYHYETRIMFKENKISLIYSQILDTNESNIGAEYGNATWSWASQNLPEDVAKVVPGEWDKFGSSGSQGLGKLSARELGQVVDRVCKAYAEATK